MDYGLAFSPYSGSSYFLTNNGKLKYFPENIISESDDLSELLLNLIKQNKFKHFTILTEIPEEIIEPFNKLLYKKYGQYIFTIKLDNDLVNYFEKNPNVKPTPSKDLEKLCNH